MKKHGFEIAAVVIFLLMAFLIDEPSNPKEIATAKAQKTAEEFIKSKRPNASVESIAPFEVVVTVKYRVGEDTVGYVLADTCNVLSFHETYNCQKNE